MTSSTFKIIIVVFGLHQEKCASSHLTSIKRQKTVRVTGHSRTVGTQNGNFSISPFWLLKLEVVARFLENKWTPIRPIIITPNNIIMGYDFFFFFCRARWLMPPDVPQPVRLIVFILL
jgi:hypothetical protein